MPTVLLFNKPFHVLSQFTDTESRATLANFIKIKKLYPAGRLDYDSEGLILLTDDGKLQDRISNPKRKLKKSYWVQVEGQADNKTLKQLKKGMQLSDGQAQAIDASIIDEPNIWQRNPPIRQRATIPNSWLQITINEGRNRQIRRMTAAVGLPTLRLIRWRIGHWQLENIQPGNYIQQTIHLPVPSPSRPLVKAI